MIRRLAIVGVVSLLLLFNFGSLYADDGNGILGQDGNVGVTSDETGKPELDDLASEGASSGASDEVSGESGTSGGSDALSESLSEAISDTFSDAPDFGGGDFPIEDLEKSLTAVMDCISASLVTECTDSNISLPCSSVSMEGESRLPLRIAYFLADPAEFVLAMSPVDTSGGLFSALKSLLNSVTKNTLVSAVYLALATRNYKVGDFLLSGSIAFQYPDGVDLQDILAVWSSRKGTGESIGLTVDMNVFGKGVENPISLVGQFDMFVDQFGSIVIRSVDTYTINGLPYRGGEFKM